MFVPQSWLTDTLDKCNPGWSVSTADLDAGFVKVGFEIEGVPHPLPTITGPLVVGQVMEIEELEGFKKPIRFCHVDVGNENGELQEIICGARNFKLHDLVIVALPGAVLPGGFEISARKTYSHMSCGMMCSATELGIEQDHSGIITLRPGTAEPGSSAYPLLNLDDAVFEVNITPDRGYALSLRGLSREIAISFGLQYQEIAVEKDLGNKGEAWPVTIEPETGTQRFVARRVTGIDPQAVTPWWMQRRLLLAGVRPISPAVDVTNYVMLELGQPLHAYDIAKLQGDITVRCAHEGEKLTTLDGVERELSSEDVVIADGSGPVGLAGVMGGAATEVGNTTTDVLFEAANFDSLHIFRTGRRHKLSSEASRRFERKVDPAVCRAAADRAATLLVEIAGGTVEPLLTDAGEVPSVAPILFPAHRPSDVAGVDYPEGTARRRLEQIGCQVDNAPGEEGVLTVTPPTWRPDLQMRADLVEEVLRLEGLEQIPVRLPQAPSGHGLTPEQRRRRMVNKAMAYAGYEEILPTPFMSNTVFDEWGLPNDDPRRRVTKVLNPLDSDYGCLATTLLPEMFDVVKRNVARGQHDLGLYGVEEVCLPDETTKPMAMLSTDKRPSDAEIVALQSALPKQPMHVAAVLTGLRDQTGPWGKGRPADVWDIIEAVRQVGRAVGAEFRFEKAELLPWHPGRCAAVYLGDECVGYAGEIHPQILDKCGLPARMCAMEVNVSALPTEYKGQSPVVSPYPPVYQDVALVVAKDVPQADIVAALYEGGGDLLESVKLFDIYESEQLGDDKRSLAFALSFRSTERTLTEEEASAARDAAVAVAAERFGAELRSL